MIDKLIDVILGAVFSPASFVVHVVFCVLQLIFHIPVNIVTNVISWEAIFLALLIGIQQIRHHEINQKVK